MRLEGRLARAEASLEDARIRWAMQYLADNSGIRSDVLLSKIQRLLEKYLPLAVPMPNGMVDIEPVLVAISEQEGLSYDSLARGADEAIAALRKERRSIKRPH